MSRKLALVAVHWLDAATTDGWESNGEAGKDPCSVYTVGFLIHESKELLVIASTSDLQTLNNARISIPFGMVKSLKRFPLTLPLKGIQRKAKVTT